MNQKEHNYTLNNFSDKPSEEFVRQSVTNMKVMNALFEFAFEVKRYQLKLSHPDLNEEMLNKETMKLIEDGCR